VSIPIAAMFGKKNKQINLKHTSVIVVRQGEIGCRQCLRTEDLGTEFRQPTIKIPART